jgi:hypothetical protein
VSGGPAREAGTRRSMGEPGARSRPTPWRLVLAVLLLLVPLSEASAAWNGWADGTAASLTLHAATLQPPTEVTTSRGLCVLGVADAVVVTWVPSTTPGVAGYEVLRAAQLAGPYSVIGTVTGRTATTYTDTTLPFNTTYYYVVRSLVALWRSDETAAVSRRTRSSLCL